MNILRIISSMNHTSGGPVEGVFQSSQVLLRLGHKVQVVTLDSPKSDTHSSSPLNIIALGPSFSSYAYCPRLFHWLKANISKYDVVLIHGLWQYHGFATRKLAIKFNIPYFVFTHGMLDPWFKITYPFKHLKKWCYWPWGEYKILRDAKGVLFTSEQERLQAKASFWLYNCNDIVVSYGTKKPVYNKNLCIKQFLEKFPALENKKILLFLSRIHPKKGCDLLLRAFAKFANQEPLLHLVMAGPDQVQWQTELEILQSELRISSQVTWTGMLNNEFKHGAFLLSKAFILPSHQENFGIAVAEALAYGIPVLISNKVNIFSEIQAQHAGFVENDDLVGTESLIRKFLALTPEDYSLMCKNAIICFDLYYDIENAARSLAEAITVQIQSG